MDENDVAFIGREFANTLMLEKLFTLAAEVIRADREATALWRSDLEADAIDRISRMKDARRAAAETAAIDRIAEVFTRIAPPPKST